LEEVRMLSNLETEKEKLIQIILIGQPELKKKLEMPKLEQFKQRVVMQYHIQPLNKTETAEYIYHRLTKAGGDKFIFNSEAIDEIFAYTKGVPRLINLACHHALISGLVYESKRITKEIALETIHELIHGLGSKPSEKSAEIDPASQADEMLRKMLMADNKDIGGFTNG